MKTIYYCHDSQSDFRPRCDDLEMVGYEVKLATNSAELNHLMTIQRPDLVLLDVLLDGKNGFAICRDLLADQGSAPPVILFAGIYSRAGFRDEALRLGAQAYLPSDISQNAFLSAVTDCIDGEGKAAA